MGSGREGKRAEAVEAVAARWGFADSGSDEELVSFLIASLNHRDLGVRTKAALELGELSSLAPLVVPQLTTSMLDRDPVIRFWAVAALSRILPRDGRDVPQLIEALKDPNPYGRLVAAMALGKMGATANAATAALTTATQDRNRGVETAARWALEALESAE